VVDAGHDLKAVEARASEQRNNKPKGGRYQPLNHQRHLLKQSALLVANASKHFANIFMGGTKLVESGITLYASLGVSSRPLHIEISALNMSPYPA
jgi:hypothetical protein